MSQYSIWLLVLAVSGLLAQSPRCDYEGSIQPTVLTSWGVWGFEQWCPAGTWAHGFYLSVEGNQGNDDDTALNGIKLICSAPGGSERYEISSIAASWGVDTDEQLCPANYFLSGARARSEANQGGDGDDTAANNYDFECKSSAGASFGLEGEGMSWGSWLDWQYCPSGSFICGIKTLVQEYQGAKSDDTALNDAIFYCCKRGYVSGDKSIARSRAKQMRK